MFDIWHKINECENEKIVDSRPIRSNPESSPPLQSSCREDDEVGMMPDVIEDVMPKNEEEAKRVFVWLIICIIAFLLAVRFCA